VLAAAKRIFQIQTMLMLTNPNQPQNQVNFKPTLFGVKLSNLIYLLLDRNANGNENGGGNIKI